MGGVERRRAPKAPPEIRAAPKAPHYRQENVSKNDVWLRLHRWGGFVFIKKTETVGLII